MKSQGRTSEPTQAKINTQRLEEQLAKGKVMETTDTPVRHTVSTVVSYLYDATVWYS